MYVVENVLFWDNIINLSQYNIPQSTKMLVAETEKFYRYVLPLLSEKPRVTMQSGQAYLSPTNIDFSNSTNGCKTNTI